jgi:hypothetical protein
LWNLGRVLGIYVEDDDETAKEMGKDLSAASRADRKAMKCSDKAEDIIRSVARGDKMDHETETKSTVLRWMIRIRASYQGSVIRRTGHSKDSTGKSIMDHIETRNHTLIVKLFDHEMAHIEYIADKLAAEKPQGGVMFAGGKVSVHFGRPVNLRYPRPPAPTTACPELWRAPNFR